MPIPPVVRDLRSLLPISVTPPFAVPAGLVKGWSLGYISIQQQDSTWCWAAVAEGVQIFYRNPQKSPRLDQCGIAQLTLQRDGKIPLGQHCCSQGSVSRPCATAHNLESALSTVNHSSTVPPISLSGQPIPRSLLQQELSNGRVVGVRYEGLSPSNVGHFAILHGLHRASNGRLFVEISDPEVAYGSPSVGLLQYWKANFAYRNTGVPTHLYLTKS